MHLSAIYFYPVKSLAGVTLQRAELDARGIRRDRHWMVVDAAGKFLTQRHYPRMALVQPYLDDERLLLSAPAMPDLVVPYRAGGCDDVRVHVWDDVCSARSSGPEAAQWLSDFLDVACRLVFMPVGTKRPVNPKYAGPNNQVGFADSFPLNVLSEGSLEALNKQLQAPVHVSRFRPNLVVSGCQPHAEDAWHRLRIGRVDLDVAKPCSRCTIPNVNPLTGEREREPVRTLATYRRFGRKILFGQHLLHDPDADGVLTVGDRVEVLPALG